MIIDAFSKGRLAVMFVTPISRVGGKEQQKGKMDHIVTIVLLSKKSWDLPNEMVGGYSDLSA